MPLFQQLTGINSIIFYSPVLFSSLGSGDKTSLESSVIVVRPTRLSWLWPPTLQRLSRLGIAAVTHVHHHHMRGQERPRS